MIPTQSIPNYDMETHPTKTYRLIPGKGIVGYCDGLEAMRQAVYKILNTDRYEYSIYSWNYGVELNDLYGKQLPFIYSELKRRISEALLQDDRIVEVDDYEFTQNGSSLMVEFTVTTNEGDFQSEWEVSV